MEAQSLLYMTYHPLDSDFALSLAADLRNAGLPVWLDLLDARTGVHSTEAHSTEAQNTEAQNTESSARAGAAIAILSPAYLQTESTCNTFTDFHTRGLPLLSLVLHPISRHDRERSLLQSPLFDFQHWHQPAVYSERLNRLISAILASTDFRLGQPDAETRFCTRLIAQLVMRRERAAAVAGSGGASGVQRAATWAAQLPLALHMPDAAHGTRKLYVESAATAQRQFQSLVITGDYGSGKTMVLERAVLEAVESFQQSWSQTHTYSTDAPLPLLLSLADWPLNVEFADFLRASYSLAPDVFGLLAAGQAALYLDGLDELAADHAPASASGGGTRLASLLEWLAGPRAPRLVMLTCRTHTGSETALVRAMLLPVIHIEPMADTQVEACIRAAMDATAAGELLTLLRSEDAPAGLVTAIRSPFMLARLVALMKAAPMASARALPQSASALLHRWLAAHWVTSRLRQIALSVERHTLYVALATLALSIMQQDRRAWTSAEAAAVLGSVTADKRGSDALLEAATTLGLLERCNGRITFAAHGLADLFAALAITSGGGACDLTPYLHQPRLTDEGARLDTKWDDVLSLVVGLAAQPDSALLSISEVDIFLAVGLLGQGRLPAPPTLQHMMARLAVVTDQYTPSASPDMFSSAVPERREAQVAVDHALNRLGQVLSMSQLLDQMRNGTDQARRFTLDIVRRTFKSEHGFSAQADDVQSREAVEADLEQLRNQPLELSLPLWAQAVKAADWETRRAAVRLLGDVGDEAVIPLLCEALADAEVPVRVEAVRALSLLESSAATEALIRALSDDHPAVQHAAADQVGTRTDAVSSLIMFGLHAHQPSVRMFSAIALGQLGDSAALVALVEATYEGDALVRSAAVEALGRLHEPEAMDRLCQCLDDYAVSHHGEGRICDLAREGLLALAMPEAEQAVQVWMQRQTQELAWVHSTAQEGGDVEALLTRLGALPLVFDEAALSLLAACLHHAVPEVRIAAIHRLHQAPSLRSLMLLFKALRDPQLEIAAEVARYLAEMSAIAPTESTLHWTAALKSRHTFIRGVAAYTLGQIGDCSALPLLKACLYDQGVVSDGYSVGGYARAAIEQIEARGADAWAGEDAAPASLQDHEALSEDDDLASVSASAFDSVSASNRCIDPVTGSWHYGSKSESEDLIEDATKDQPSISVAEALERVLPHPEDMLDGYSSSAPDSHWPTLPPLDSEWEETEPSPAERVGLWLELPALFDDMRAARNEIQRSHIAREILNEAYARHKELARHEERARHENQVGEPVRTDAAMHAQLAAALGDPLWSVRAAACGVLALLPDAEAVPALVCCLQDREIEVRLSAIRALAEAVDLRALPALAGRAHDAHPQIRAAAAEAMGRFGEQAPLKLLMALSVDGEQIVRRAALNVLDALQDRRALPAFLHALKDKNMYIRRIALEALARLRDARSVPALAECLHSPETTVLAGQTFAEAAAHTLSVIGTPEADAAVQAWQAGRSGSHHKARP